MTLFSPEHSEDEGKRKKYAQRPKNAQSGDKHGRRNSSSSNNSAGSEGSEDRAHKRWKSDDRPLNPFIEEVCKLHGFKDAKGLMDTKGFAKM